MTQYLSEKIKVLSFISIVAVIFWHGYMTPPLEQFQGFYLFENIVTSSLVRFSIPLFFAISGYLFFLKPFNYVERLKKRAKSLLLPYLIWSTVGVIFIYTIQLIPTINCYLHTNWPLTPMAIFTHLTIDPIQYQFWFLRDLIVLVIISPLIKAISKHLSLPIITILTVLWFWLGDQSFVVRIDSILFFIVGSSLAIHKIDIEQKATYSSLFTTGFLWIAFGVLDGYLKTYSSIISGTNIFYSTSIAAGVLFIWSIYNYISSFKIVQYLIKSPIVNSTFFIFCFHEPLLTIFEKITLQFATPHTIFLFYFINPTVVIFLSYQIAKIVNTNFRAISNILTGSR